jgi:transposase InsO family protein
VNRFQFVADHQQRYGVKRLCQVLGVARSSYYYWTSTAEARAARQAAEAVLAGQIRKIHAVDNTYGVPRITAELHDNGTAVNHKRVERVMRGIGVRGLRLRRRTRTTIGDPAAVKAPDLIGRDFTAPAVNQRYVGDITYLPVGERGFLYLATVIDLHSRRLAGWAIADHMRTDLVIDALNAAQRTRGSLAGAIFHSDHGAQYTSKAFAAVCAAAGVRQSMSKIGSSADNALAEFVQRDLQTRNPAGPPRVHRRTRRPAHQLPLAAPLQHRPPPLPARTTVPDHLRADPRKISYHHTSRINPVSKFRG